MDNENSDALYPDDISIEKNNEGEKSNKTENITDVSSDKEIQTNNLSKPHLSPMDSLLETNISDWDYESAKNYVVEFIATANKYRDDYKEKLADLKKWAKRLELAQASNRPELIKEAEKLFAKLSIETQSLKEEFKKLEMHADILKQQLAEKNKYVPENDPSLLLHKLETILEKSSDEIEMNEKIKNFKLKDKLESLKKKIEEED